MPMDIGKLRLRRKDVGLSLKESESRGSPLDAGPPERNEPRRAIIESVVEPYLESIRERADILRMAQPDSLARTRRS